MARIVRGAARLTRAAAAGPDGSKAPPAYRSCRRCALC
ncbi:conserved hypothetical protein [Streptomyces filamentosus NRRL 15998]|uniref:Uncharacterized protein n=1 Tax=Streptomyces filamentosus NRRL 15998 TaxID=457431 RepID=D6AK83_STRFL|nr:conserved hypothetical protein [Streptomyces filamentosus NRRL 15998]